MRALRLGTVTWLVVLIGCANVPPPGRPIPERPHVMGAASVVMPLSPPASQEASTPGLPGERLERLTLADALARAERLHPELAAGRAQIERAEGLALQAGLFPNPELVARMESATLARNERSCHQRQSSWNSFVFNMF